MQKVSHPVLGLGLQVPDFGFGIAGFGFRVFSFRASGFGFSFFLVEVSGLQLSVLGLQVFILFGLRFRVF